MAEYNGEKKVNRQDFGARLALHEGGSHVIGFVKINKRLFRFVMYNDSDRYLTGKATGHYCNGREREKRSCT